MQTTHALISPVIALVVWTFVIWFWMYFTRIPAILKSRMVLDGNAPRGEQMAQLPAKVRWKADNYNHLLEQPILFYATSLSLVLLGNNSALCVNLAWAYVALRIVHSLVQCLINHIPTRFAVFFVSSLVLLALVLQAAIQVF
jgi:hypothetical protein